MADKSKVPMVELQPQFSSEGAAPVSWTEGREQLEKAQTYWVVTVRPDGRPHVTPLISVWLDGALYFTTGASERKARNLLDNPHCILMTGCNDMQGLDVVVEGDAVKVSDAGKLERVADSLVTKYGWHFTARDGALYGDGGRAEVYEVAPVTAFGFGKGEPFSQTRWRFQEE